MLECPHGEAIKKLCVADCPYSPCIGQNCRPCTQQHSHEPVTMSHSQVDKLLQEMSEYVWKSAASGNSQSLWVSSILEKIKRHGLATVTSSDLSKMMKTSSQLRKKQAEREEIQPSLKPAVKNDQSFWRQTLKLIKWSISLLFLFGCLSTILHSMVEVSKINSQPRENNVYNHTTIDRGIKIQTKIEEVVVSREDPQQNVEKPSEQKQEHPRQKEPEEPKYSQIHGFSCRSTTWSPYLKHSDISVSGCVVSRLTASNVRNNQYTDVGVMLDINTDIHNEPNSLYVWTLKVRRHQDLIGMGLCLVSQFKRNGYDAGKSMYSSGQGAYLLWSNGYTTSYSREFESNKDSIGNMVDGDEYGFMVQTKDKKIIMIRKRGNDISTLKYEKFNNGEYRPCVFLGKGDQVELSNSASEAFQNLQ